MLSTCNRVELYTGCEDPKHAPTRDQVIQFLADYHGMSREEVAAGVTSQTREEAIRHLFTVAASMDSMVVGEPQILAQVKEAFSQSSESGMQTFDSALLELYKSGKIGMEEALANADSRSNLEASIHFG